MTTLTDLELHILSQCRPEVKVAAFTSSDPALTTAVKLQSRGMLRYLRCEGEREELEVDVWEITPEGAAVLRHHGQSEK